MRLENVGKIIDSLNVPVGVIDPKSMKFVYINNGFSSLFGYGKGEIVDLDISTLSTIFIDKKTFAKEVEILKAHKNLFHKAEIECKNGDRLFMELFLFFVELDGIDYIFFSCVEVADRDSLIKKEKEIELQISEIDRHNSMASLISSISHHWRQPLNIISLSADTIEMILEDKGVIDDEIKKELHKINEKTRTLSQTIDSFRNILGNPDEIKGEFDLLEILQESHVLSLTHIEQTKEKIDVTFSTDLKDCSIKGFKSSLKKVIYSILLNAQEAIVKRECDGCGKIDIELTQVDKFFKISITNNGVPITKEERKKLFEPYYTTKFMTQDVGLSLFYNKIIIERIFQGRLDLDKEFREGAKFNIFIPIERRECE
ncbi:MAG: PAS domain-containing sensor histidine kinase [Campylobacterales bacterium]|nr:PAS domain-containing sensor histidine kinase [Campylobacterales bacterium]